MMRSLFRHHSHQEGTNFSVDILQDEDVQRFISGHADILDSAFDEVQMSDSMRRDLRNSDYIFSGMKTFHELHEAFPSLLNPDGSRKSFERFLNDVQTIDRTYNRRYLKAEYDLAHSSAIMAARWEEIAGDGDRYLLQYRTAGDGKVRPDHAALNGITLPPSDPFWQSFFPPNGWGCRCTAVQVRRGKYPLSDHNEAMQRGEQALAKDKKGIFRFNPGQQRTAFPDYNPYTISKCRDCNMAKGKAQLAKHFIPDNELCEACRVVRAHKIDNVGASGRIQKYDEKKWEHSYISPDNNGFVVTELERIAEAAASNSERQKYEKEMRMCKVLADNGHDIEYLQGVNRPAGQTYDIRLDNVKADLKCITGGAGNIVKYAKKALTKQGGEAVVFEMPEHSPGIYEAITEARRKCKGKIFFYFTDDTELKEVKIK